jgi:signal transduction histidine kinase
LALPAPGAAEQVGWRVVAAAIALAVAGAAGPIAVSAIAATRGLLDPPLATSALAALLVLAPAAVGLAAAMTGIRRLAAGLAAQGGSEAEAAVLRVIVDLLLFGHALTLTVLAPADAAAPACVPVAGLALVGGWAMLLHVIVWPAAPPARRIAALVLDIVLFSAFLHYGGEAVAGWYPFYLILIAYAGLRFGRDALIVSAVGAGLGFAAVVFTTEIWRQHPALSAGLLLGLALMPALVAGAMRMIAAARAEVAVAAADKHAALRLVADALRDPSLSQIDDIVEFAALESGATTLPVEGFDLRALVGSALAPARAEAAEIGVALRWRIDPRLPIRLSGPAEILARVLAGLARHAVGATQAPLVRLTLDAAAADGDRVKLQARIVGEAALADDKLAFGLQLVRRLAELAGGDCSIGEAADRRGWLAATLTMAIEDGGAGPAPDLAGAAVLIVTDDRRLSTELAEQISGWHGEPRWIGDADATLADTREAAACPIVIVDGRRKLLSAVSLAHQAARAGGPAPFVLLFAEAAQIASLGEFDEDEFDALIPAPLREPLLANALRSLPLEPAPAGPRPAADPAPRHDVPSTGDGAAAAGGANRITPIAAHPRYVPDPAAAVDAQVVEALRVLGGGAGFLREVIESFYADAGQIMRRIADAATAADPAAFAANLAALRRTVSHLGAQPLCELLVSLQDLTAGELRRQGAVHVQRLDAEIERLTAALIALVPSAEARRS